MRVFGNARSNNVVQWKVYVNTQKQELHKFDNHFQALCKTHIKRVLRVKPGQTNQVVTYRFGLSDEPRLRDEPEDKCMYIYIYI